MSEIADQVTGRTVIVGSGLAGLMTALTLAPEPVVIVTRAGLGAETSSAWAQGGIAASLGADDSADLHLADTLAAGDGLCDPVIAAGIVAEAPAAIAALERAGVGFDKTPDGSFSLGLEAAHSRRRIVHADGDGSGAAIVRALVAAVSATPSITVLEGLEARRILTDESGVSGLVCASENGAVILPTRRIVLATGGIGGLYEATTNPTGNFGQGIMLAARAGAELADMEFVQFHPTALDSRRRPLALVSEAVRGEGAVLVNGAWRQGVPRRARSTWRSFRHAFSGHRRSVPGSRSRCVASADPGAPCRPLSHGRGSDRCCRPQLHCRPVGCRRGGLNRPARRKSARQQFTAGGRRHGHTCGT
jgi:L-aspartate oxidase